jgi:hypothetical protein
MIASAVPTDVSATASFRGSTRSTLQHSIIVCIEQPRPAREACQRSESMLILIKIIRHDEVILDVRKRLGFGRRRLALCISSVTHTRVIRYLTVERVGRRATDDRLIRFSYRSRERCRARVRTLLSDIG